MDVLRKARTAARLAVRPFADERERRLKAPLYTSLHSNFDPALHLREAAAWLVRAQDAGADRGVSYGADFGQDFLPSYPETTGYIINTFLDLARHYSDSDYRRRAIEMGEWESAVQMSSGAVMGGMYNTSPTPSIFNTGMVLLGWAALLRETGSERFRDSGQRAASWLVEMQEPDGNWIRGLSQFANSDIRVYNVKAAWGLAEMAAALNSPDFTAAAVRNAVFTLTKQESNGWFRDCCLEDAERPLLHTIAYTMQGLIGIGEVARRNDFVAAAERTAKSLARLMDAEGFIPGKISRDFTGAVNWCCLTGTAQTSIVWSHLHRITGDASYAEAADRANRYLMARHDISSSDQRICGGLAGSWPVWAPYGKFRILNWATKFFVDALLLPNG
jgi:hypothetical protein